MALHAIKVQKLNTHHKFLATAMEDIKKKQVLGTPVWLLLWHGQYSYKIWEKEEPK